MNLMANSIFTVHGCTIGSLWKPSLLAHLFKVDDDPAVTPLDDEVRVDLDREVAVVDLEDLKVVEPDAHVERLGGALLAPRVDRRDIPAKELPI